MKYWPKRERKKRRRVRLLLISTLLLLKPSAVIPQAQSGNPSPKPAEQTQDDFQTPLMRAAFAGRVDEVRDLLKSGVDVNEKDVLGCTALTFAVVKGNIDVAKVLLQAGADPNAAGGIAHVGFCSVMIFAMQPRPDRLELIDMLIAAGGKLNPPSTFPHSPLMSAVQFKDIDLINALLKRGADVNWANSIGTTALQEAITIGEPNVEVIRLLLKAGADPNKPRLWVGNVCISLLTALDEPLMMSNNQTNRQIGDLLRRAGAKKYKRQSRGRPCYE